MSVRRSCTTLLAALAVAAASGCADATGPAAPAPHPLDLVYLDNLYRLTVLRVGGTPVLSSVANAVPFAAAAGTVLFADSVGMLSTLGVADGMAGHARPTLVPNPATRQAGALSADGRVLTWMEAVEDHAFLYWADVGTGARDSVDLLPTMEPTTLLRMLGSAPAISPDGRTTAFLLQRTFTMQLVRIDRGTYHASSVMLDVPVATEVEPLVGRPRWLADGSLRFLARLHTLAGAATDTLAVLEVHADRPDAGALVRFLGAPPEAISLVDARDYSFSDDGDAVAFILASPAREGIFLLRRGGSGLEPLVYGDGVQPHYPMLVPAAR